VLNDFLIKAEKYNGTFCRAVEVVGLLGLLLVLVLTCVDVVGAKVFTRPVPGSLDIVMLAQLVAVSFALGSTLLVGRHIKVEFLLPYLPGLLRKVVDFVVQCFILFLFILIVWRLAVYGYNLYVDNEGSLTVRIPLYPFAFGLAFACLPVCFYYIISILKLISGTKKNVA